MKQMSKQVQQVLVHIEKCKLPKLNRNLEECDIHPEFELWKKHLSENSKELKVLLNDANFQECADDANTVIASLLILYYELISEGPWQSETVKECLDGLNYQFGLLYSLSMDKLLTSRDNKVFNVQAVFDKCMELLHCQLTADDYKKYPALVEVYFLIIEKLKEYELYLKPTSLLPLSLLLIEDYVKENKIKGLQCCSSILQCLTPEHFQDGNYYEVIYSVLKKLVTEKDIKVTNLVFECLLYLYKIMPSNDKVTTIDDTLHIVLEQLYIESNLHKKKALLCFVNKLIPMQGIHCVKRMFLTVISDNLDVCSNKSVAEILLEDVVECLENWTRYCWCVWRLQPNKKLLSVLIKILYIYCEDEKLSARLQNILLTLFKLCSIEEQKQIHNHLETQIKKNVSKESFNNKIDVIKNELNVRVRTH